MIDLDADIDGCFNLRVGEVVFKQLFPVLNGCVLDDWISKIEVSQNEKSFVRDKTIVFFDPENDQKRCLIIFKQHSSFPHPIIKFLFEGLNKTEIIDSFGIQFTSVQGSRAFLNNGYTSWNGSR